MRISWTVLAAAAALFIAAPGFAADTYPSKPVKIISPFPPGSGIDIISRALGDKLSPALGQPVVVENRPGAGGTIGEAVVAQSKPDGYTILVTSSSHTANPVLYSKLSYDGMRDLAAVTPLAVLPNLLVVTPNNSKGIKSVADLIAYGKAHPGQLNYASAGTGSATHMSDEKFRVTAGFEAVHVPFKGTPEAMTEIISGRIDYMFTPTVTALSLIQNKQLAALAISASKRSPLLPDVPTLVQAGLPNADYTFWAAMFVPSKTPRAIVDRLHQEVTKVAKSDEFKARLASLGADPYMLTPDEFAAVMTKELPVNRELIQKAHIPSN